MKRETLWLSLIYCSAHIPLFITFGQYYDDWVLYLADQRLNVELWSKTGRPFAGPFLNFFLNLDGVIFPRVCAFVAYWSAGLFFRSTLATVSAIDPPARFMLVAFFMVFPADSTRVLAMLAYDSSCYLLFFLGWWLLSRYLASRQPFLRVGALVAFFLSFWLNSLLVLFAVVVAYLAYREAEGTMTWRSAFVLAKKYADFLVVPFIFWILQRAFFPPTAEYEGYNRLSIAGLSPFRWMRAIEGGFIDPIVYSVIPVTLFIVLIILAGTSIFTVFFRARLTEPNADRRSDSILFGIGLLAIFLALLPYVVVGKAPDYWDWSSRHARLIPLGASCVLVYGIRLCGKLVRARWTAVLFIQCLLLSIFITGNVRTYAWYWVDWYKALSLVKEMKASDIIRDNTSFLFKDDAQDLNAKKRWLRFYEYAALMHQAFGDETRAGFDERHWPGPREIEEVRGLLAEIRKGMRTVDPAKAYFLSQWTPKSPEHRVTIQPVNQDLGFKQILAWKLRELLHRPSFEQEPPNLVRLKFEKITSPGSFHAD